jgi:hypothetical protein
LLWLSARLPMMVLLCVMHCRWGQHVLLLLLFAWLLEYGWLLLRVRLPVYARWLRVRVIRAWLLRRSPGTWWLGV